jgi:pimeloyl-ACP methyl ester carboxylesterase
MRIKVFIAAFIVFLSTFNCLNAQNYSLERYGFRHFTTVFHDDTVDLIVNSRKGEEDVTKPVIFFGGGSTPRPILFLSLDNQIFGAFPFITDSLLQDYHLVIADNPFVPWIYPQDQLKNNQYIDPETGFTPAEYNKRDYLDYYVERNLYILNYLKEKEWVANDKFVVAGHSASSGVMAKLASISEDVTHLIYSNGNPYGRILSMISVARSHETPKNPAAERLFTYWQNVVNDPERDFSSSGGDTNKATYSFSGPLHTYLEKTDIPVLVSYGAKDRGAPYNDLFRVNIIREGKENFTFIAYPGLEHNYFGFKEAGEVDYEKFGWDKVVLDWKEWLKKN